MTQPLKPYLLTALGSLVLGIIIATLWHNSSYPGRPLFVEVVNLRTDAIPLLRIEHGNDYSQERILLTQLQPEESRMISLNHEPKRGYNVEVQLQDGSTSSACVGKLSDEWVNRVIITSNGIFSYD